MPNPSSSHPRALFSCGSCDGAVVWCDACEARHYHSGDVLAAARMPSHCHDGPGSPYVPSYFSTDIGRVDDPDDLMPLRGFRQPYWRRLRDRRDALQGMHAATILGLPVRRRAPMIAMRVVGEEVRLQRNEWQAIGPASIVEGHDLLTLARHVHRLSTQTVSGAGLRCGMVAARIVEESAGVSFDAKAFLGIVDTVEDFYRRGAPYGEGRRR